MRQNGTVANSTTYVTSDYIAVEGKRTITAHPLALGPIYFSQYDSSKEFITSIQNAQTLTVTLESNTAYVRATFLASNYKTEGQIEYGLTSTEYEPFHYVISEESLPGGIGGGTTRDEVKQIINEEVFPAKLVLPSSLYFKANRQNNLYYKQAIKCSCHDSFDFSVSNATLKVFDRQLSGTPANSSVLIISLRFENLENCCKSCKSNLIYLPILHPIRQLRYWIVGIVYLIWVAGKLN